MSGSIYETLDPNGGIRLLILEPGQDEALISCRLVSHNINLSPDYTALSYEWGSQDVQNSISLNGQEFHVGENLWWALWYLRIDGAVTRLWVDALCINQQDEKERGHQVSLMGKIYRNAEVICWLGKGDDPKHVKAMEYICNWPFVQDRARARQSGSSESAMSMDRQNSTFSSSDSEDAADYPPSTPSDTLATVAAARSRPRIQPRAGATSMLHDEDYRSKETPYFSELEALCSHSYWTRTWIIQEFVLGKIIKIRLGPRQTRGENVQDIALEVLRQRLNEGGIHMLDAFRIFNLREDQLQGHRLPLFKLVELSEKSSCQDLRDRIYAMIGLASDCRDGEIVPDYSKPLSEVYDDVVIRHFYPSDRDIFGHSWSTVQASCLIQRVLWKTSESLSRFLEDSSDQQDHDLNLLSIHGESCGTVRELSLPQRGMWWAHPGLVKAISPVVINKSMHTVSRVITSILSWIWSSQSSEAGDEYTEYSEETGTAILRADIGGSLTCYVPGCTRVGDRICRFVNSSIVAVLRLSRTSTILVGRGMILNRVGDLDIFEEGVTTPMKDFTDVMFEIYKPVLSFDLTSMQLKNLTSPHY